VTASADASIPKLGRDEDVLDLGNAERRLVPRNMRLADRLAVLPGDQIGLRPVETRERQPCIDLLEVGPG
jgi:hypothetical protein